MAAPKRGYAVQPSCYGERKADYKEQEYLNNAFETYDHKKMYDEISKIKKGFGGACGNIAHEIVFSKPKNKIIVDIQPNRGWTPPVEESEEVRNYQVMSSALMMYRIICMFPSPIIELEGADGYKVPWSVCFKHKETGEFFIIREWKGGLSFASDLHSFMDCKNKTEREKLAGDVQRLLQLLMSDKSPHPYDGVTAGGVA